MLTFSEIVQCPQDLTASSTCQSDNTWHGQPGWRTTLTSTFRPANVAYSRLNGSIVSFSFTSEEEKPAPVGSKNMLQAYRDAFGSFTSALEVMALWTAPSQADMFPIYAYPAIVAANLKGVNKLGQHNPAVQNRAAASLQCILAIMIYYAQPSLFARYLSTVKYEDESLQTFKKDILSISPPGTKSTVAVPRYQIVVGQSTLIAYLVLSAVPLLACTAIVLFVTLSSTGREIPSLTPFPPLDVAVRCRNLDDGQLTFGNTAIERACLDGQQSKLLNRLSQIWLTTGENRNAGTG